MTKKKTLEDSIVEESEHYRDNLAWLQTYIKSIIADTPHTDSTAILNYMKFYKEVNQDLMNAKVQNAAFLKMVEQKLKDPDSNRELLHPSSTSNKSAGLG